MPSIAPLCALVVDKQMHRSQATINITHCTQGSVATNSVSACRPAFFLYDIARRRCSQPSASQVFKGDMLFRFRGAQYEQAGLDDKDVSWPIPRSRLLKGAEAVMQVFEGGALFDPMVLDIKDEDLMKSVSAAIANVAAASLELGHPTLASIPHMVVHGYKNVLAVAIETDYDFPLAEKVRSCVLSTSVFDAQAACNFWWGRQAPV